MNARLAKKNRASNPEAFAKVYEAEVTRRIRTKYTVNQELAVLRQRDTKPEEFAEYNDFAERCKEEVKAELEM